MLVITSHSVPGLAESWVLLIYATIGLAVLLLGHRRRGPSLLAGLPERLPRTGDVVEFDRLAGAVKVQAANQRKRVRHVNPRERRPYTAIVDEDG